LWVSTLSGVRMLLIAAALEEQLKIAMETCRELEKIHSPGISLWQGARGGSAFCFLKTRVGPAKAAASLEKALDHVQPEQILMIGYAGALDPALKLGDLVAVTKATLFSLDRDHPDWNDVQLDGSFDLTHADSLAVFAKSHGMKAVSGSALTSSHVLGDPAHKDSLFRKYHAFIVDMETAALARVAASRGISMSCIRAVSDEARDTFLAPFSFDPSMGMTVRAKKLLNKGMTKTYREWKDHAAVAKASLSCFLAEYL
jgi:nucleoside phosphorylase